LSLFAGKASQGQTLKGGKETQTTPESGFYEIIRRAIHGLRIYEASKRL